MKRVVRQGIRVADDDWEWVVPPDNGAVSGYRGSDLVSVITTGNQINRLRLNAGLSVQDVEDYAGIKKSDLLAMEAGLLELGNDMADALANVLGVSVAELKG